MGSWNKTCGLTNLPITMGVPVYMLVIQPIESEWSAKFPFIQCEYDDYGGGQNCDSNLQFAIRTLLPNAALTDSEFFNAIHENNLKTPDGTTISFVMFRKDAVDAILNQWSFESYVGDSAGNCGYKNNYRKVDFKEVLKDLADIEQLLLTADEEELHDLFKYQMVLRRPFNNNNLVLTALKSLRDEMYWTINPMKLVENCFSENPESANALLKNICTTAFILWFMQSSHIPVSPTLCDNQSSKVAAHKLRCKIITDIIKTSFNED